MNRALLIVAILAAAYGLLYLVPVERTNPPTTAAVSAPAEVADILRRACYDCHSNETAWPWYSHVVPASWLVAHDVKEGREHLNFSEWGTMPAEKQAHALEEIVEEVEKGAMPLANYVRLHPEAKVNEADLAALRRWAEAIGPGGQTGSSGGETGQPGDDEAPGEQNDD